MKRKSFGILVLLPLLVACAEETTTFFQCEGYRQDGAVVDVGFDSAEPGDLVAGEVDAVVSGDSPTGAACVANSECFTGSCFCGEGVTDGCVDLKEGAAGLGVTWDYVLPGGMCSKLECDPANAEACGDGAFCFDVASQFGASSPMGLCVTQCEEYFDCRYAEGYFCYYTGVEGQRACLPADIIEAIPCGNDACDNGETAATCPRDCP